MPRYLTISIDKSCDQSWDKMDRVCDGRFCHVCEKTVVDLSGKSNDELVEFFLKKQPGVCGRLHSYQLGTPITIPRKPLPYVKYFFNFLLPAFLFSTKASAQKILSPKQEQVSNLKNEKNIQAEVETGYKLIRGVVKDFLNKPVPYASVQELGTENGTSCNEQGEFMLQVKKKTDSLVISAVGFDDKVIAVDAEFVLAELTKNKSVDLDPVILATTSCTRWMGAMSIAISRYKIEKFKKDHQFLIYPNPAKAGLQSIIKLDSTIIHPLYVCIYNMQGQLVSSKLYGLESVVNRSELKFNIPQLPAGEYAVKLIDEKTRFSKSALMMVQP